MKRDYKSSEYRLLTFSCGPKADEILLEVGLWSGIKWTGCAKSYGRWKVVLIKVFNQLHFKVIVG